MFLKNSRDLRKFRKTRQEVADMSEDVVKLNATIVTMGKDKADTDAILLDTQLALKTTLNAKVNELALATTL